MQPLGLSAPGAYGDLAAPPAKSPGLHGVVHSVFSSLGALFATSFLYESAAGAQHAVATSGGGADGSEAAALRRCGADAQGAAATSGGRAYGPEAAAWCRGGADAQDSALDAESEEALAEASLDDVALCRGGADAPGAAATSGGRADGPEARRSWRGWMCRSTQHISD